MNTVRVKRVIHFADLFRVWELFANDVFSESILFSVVHLDIAITCLHVLTCWLFFFPVYRSSWRQSYQLICIQSQYDMIFIIYDNDYLIISRQVLLWRHQVALELLHQWEVGNWKKCNQEFWSSGSQVFTLSLTLTHLPWIKWPLFWQTTISNAFSWMKIIEFWFEFHWNLFPGVQLTISQHWFR